MENNDLLLRMIGKSFSFSKILRILNLTLLILTLTGFNAIAAETLAAKSAAQPRTITGVVSDEAGEPMIGVTVSV